MRKVIFAAIILLSCFGTCFGQAIKPDTLTIYGTFPVYGREAEWMDVQNVCQVYAGFLPVLHFQHKCVL